MGRKSCEVYEEIIETRNMKRLIIADVKSPNFKGISTGHFFAVAQNYYELFKGHVETLIAGGPVYKIRFSEEQLLGLPNDVLLMREPSWRSKWKYLRSERAHV